MTTDITSRVRALPLSVPGSAGERTRHRHRMLWAGLPILLLTVVLAGSPASATAATAGADARVQQAGADTTPEPRYELDTLRVEAASRTEEGKGGEGRSVEVLTRDEIRAIPARDVGDLLRWLTGVEVRDRSAAQADLSIRGSSFEQVVVLVDGVRRNDPQTGHFTMNLTVPLEQIRRIEVVRGPASALYGADALGGVVNIVTEDAGGGEASSGASLERVRAEGGGFGQAGVGVTGRARAGEVGLTGGAEFRRSDGHRPGTDSRIGKARLRSSAPVGGGRLKTDVGFALRDFGANGFFSSFDSYEETRTVTASAGWEPDPSASGVRIEPRLDFRLHDDDFVLVRDDPSLFRNLHTNWQVGGEVVARGSPGDVVSLAGGVEAYQDLLESNNLGSQSESRGAAFAEVTAGEPGELVATVGLRGDWHEVYGFEPSPSASVAVWPVPALKLRASGGRSFRTPSWIERFLDSPANVGRPGLEPEVAWSGEAGAELAAGSGVLLSAVAFVREAEDLIDWSKPEGAGEEVPWRTRNVESATFRGLEFGVRARSVAGFRVDAALELLSLDTRETEGFVSKRALRPLTEKARVTVSRRLLGDVSVAARGLRARRRGGGDAFHRLDLRTAYRVGGLRVVLEGTNVTDESYPDITGRRAPGRALLVGLEWGRPAAPGF